MHSYCWDGYRRKHFPQLCSWCNKEILIQYKSHPTLHTPCLALFKQNRPDETVPIEGAKLDEDHIKQELRKTYEAKKHEDELARLAREKEQAARREAAQRQRDEERARNTCHFDDPCDRILACQFDYYRVLVITEREADVADTLKKRYYQQALLVHPDKCGHARAEDAFKILGIAYACLSDAALRAAYDSDRANNVHRHAESVEARADVLRALLVQELYKMLAEMIGKSLFATKK